ncbi:MAG: hypothetical protein KGJ79_06445 [Alphaproteobacteria bacterium]|nr:hypothetical protein [Alphaproteobacteria bacterium]MDE2110763.1 hypothetical protein [Alphaproteobacteria bacterium]MDE2494568.1 hypothetical protein [Alphaproteobacteria bacterium]
MDQLIHYLNEALDFFRKGFAHVNAILGLIIALFAAFQLSSWKKLWEIALAATLVHIAALVLIPVIDHSAPLRLPPLMDLSFWRDTLAVYVGYIIIIAVFFFMRTRLLKGGGHH